MATMRRATARQATTMMMIPTSEDEDDNDGNGKMSKEVNNDSDGGMGNVVMEYDDNNDIGAARRATKSTIMANGRQAMTMTTTTMVTAQRDATIK